MNPKYIACGLVTMVAVLLIFIHCQREDFSTRRDKAVAITDWFKLNPNPSYVKYRDDLKSASNIVEYKDAYKLFQNKNLTVESVESVI